MGEFFKGWRRKILALNLSGSYRLAAMFSTPNRDKGRMLFADGEHGQEKRHRQEDSGKENREEDVHSHHGWYRTGDSRSAPTRGPFVVASVDGPMQSNDAIRRVW
jgi:hypothetical protein